MPIITPAVDPTPSVERLMTGVFTWSTRYCDTRYGLFNVTTLVAEILSP